MIFLIPFGQVPEKDHLKQNMREGVIMFFSFAVFGSMPLFGYILFPITFTYLEDSCSKLRAS